MNPSFKDLIEIGKMLTESIARTIPGPIRVVSIVTAPGPDNDLNIVVSSPVSQEVTELILKRVADPFAHGASRILSMEVEMPPEAESRGRRDFDGKTE